MKKAARTLLHFVFCFAPAAAMFALTLEWARQPEPPPPPLPSIAVAPASADAPLTISFAEPTVAPSEEMSAVTTEGGHPAVIVIDRDGASHTLYAEGGMESDGTPLIDVLTKRVATETQTIAASFDDRLTRSGYVTLGLALVTLTGGFGLCLFQRRIPGRTP